ncbi:MAG TPA: S-methyl-5-thioribose kinase [Anaerolineae bacterium]|nr:S-methyl-5-thioribose kinase [Anaerolineae bacterium]
MSYYALDTTTVIDYIKTRPALDGFFPAGAPLTAREVGDGNLNLVFFVENADDPTNSLVVKQALPYLRVVGESWPLTRERVRYETQALRKHNEVAPGLAPQVYDYEEEMSTLMMEHLREHEIMRKPLVERKRFPKFADHISTFLANSLFFTSDLYLTGEEKKQLQATFTNEHLRKLQEDFVYTNPYMESEENNWNPLVDDAVQAVRWNAELKMAIAEAKRAYTTHAEALIHADLHTGSIMLNEEDTRVIDPEFAFFGPMAYDVGAVLQNLGLNYLSHFAHTPDKKERESYQIYLLETIRDIWNGFAAKFDALWQENNRGEAVPNKYWKFPGGDEAFAEYRQRYLLRLLRETALHGGTKYLRRMMGIVSVWDISSIEDPEKRAAAERAAIRIGSRWILEKNRFNGIDDLIGVMREETARIAL